jgi:hypothetical protein
MMPESPTSEPSFPAEMISLDDVCVRLTLDFECSFDQAIEYVDAAIRFTRQAGKRLLLVNALNISGFASPSVTDRHRMVEVWAAASGGAVKMAMVAPARLIDHERIGVTMAQNRSFNAGTFDNEAEALTWLLGSAS